MPVNLSSDAFTRHVLSVLLHCARTWAVVITLRPGKFVLNQQCRMIITLRRSERGLPAAILDQQIDTVCKTSVADPHCAPYVGVVARGASEGTVVGAVAAHPRLHVVSSWKRRVVNTGEDLNIIKRQASAFEVSTFDSSVTFDSKDQGKR